MLALAAWMRLARPSPDSSSLYRVQRGPRSYIGAPRMSPKIHQTSKQAVKLPDARRPLQYHIRYSPLCPSMAGGKQVAPALFIPCPLLLCYATPSYTTPSYGHPGPHRQAGVPLAVTQLS